MAPQTIAVGQAGRAYPGESVSGDSWAVDWDNGLCRIAVIDGLGHGPPAAEAARAAREALAEFPGLPPIEALQVCHRALAGSRGAAIWIARIDPGAAQLTYAGVGNVEARLWQENQERRLVSYRGIVGALMPKLKYFECTLGQDWLLLIHTDGVSARFELAALPELSSRNPHTIAEALVHQKGRQTDDATVVVACPNAGVDH